MNDNLGNYEQQIKIVLDVGAGGTGFATLLGYLPEGAALLTIIWTITRLLEADYSKTVKRFRAVVNFFKKNHWFNHQ